MKGLYPKVLEELLIRRNSLKRRLAQLKDKKEELEKEISLAEAKGEDITDALKSKYSSVCFNVTCLNIKQLALKVYMNTFYGEDGNSGFLFFLQALAGGVTLAGQQNIKLIANLIRSKRFGVKYGNTNSLYLVCPEKYFWEYDKKYILEKISKKKYWKEMVEISMKPSSEIVLRILKKLKDGNKVGNNKADNDKIDEDDLDEDKEDEDKIDEDEVSKIRDVLALKLAEKWIRGYIKNLCDGLKR
ncbi:hypothetical protein C1645_741957 [Glomus cerebriforme]|uniref:DNA-directed DNA polymerase n=1 Tax=Glomus cerebriforme TaxID=658196 RepID=A0A397SLE0_9GLOM|nr:hypothetical protein C1645_741957 [Glomus cerebriforme]